MIEKCMMCKGTDFMKLGNLGSMEYFRCRNCGVDIYDTRRD